MGDSTLSVKFAVQDPRSEGISHYVNSHLHNVNCSLHVANYTADLSIIRICHQHLQPDRPPRPGPQTGSSVHRTQPNDVLNAEFILRDGGHCSRAEYGVFDWYG